MIEGGLVISGPSSGGRGRSNSWTNHKNLKPTKLLRDPESLSHSNPLCTKEESEAQRRKVLLKATQ